MRPRELPRIRRQIWDHLTDPDSSVRTETGDQVQAGLDAAAVHLRASDLYWVSAPMAALATHAGQQLAAASWTVEDRPSGCGLIVMQDGVGVIDSGMGGQLPVDAISWGPISDGLLLWAWIDRHRIAEAAHQRGLEILTDQIPPLVPMLAEKVPAEANVPFATIDGTIGTGILQTVAAAWLLMQQPQLVDRSQERPDGSTARSLARAGWTDPTVTVVDLRRQYTPDDSDRVDTDGRRYRHRWVVSGHWREQPYGPDRALRRRQWIPAHIKGPDGAPLLATEKVNVWRR